MIKRLALIALFALLPTITYAADTKLTALTEDASPGTDSLIYTVDDPGGSPVSRKSTLANVLVDGNIPNDITITLAATATALAANGANCSAGNSPLGVDASGAVEGCFAVLTAEVDGSTTNEIQNLFETISTSSGTSPVADSATDTLTLTGGTGITITGVAGTDTITIATTVVDTDTNANTICAGTTTYLDGEGNCDDISSVYESATSNNIDPDRLNGDATDDNLVDSSIVEQHAGTDISADLEEEGVTCTGCIDATDMAADSVGESELIESMNFTGTGDFDFGGGVFQIPNSATLPATCEVGDAYMDSDATTGQRFFLCESANTWALQGDGGGGGGDSITVNTSAATNPDFADGDIDWTLTGGNSITATVACSGCVDATDMGADSVGESELIESMNFTGTGDFDFGGGVFQIPNSATLPGTCEVGDAYMDTDATTGQRFYLCQSANTWAVQGDGGGTAYATIQEDGSSLTQRVTLNIRGDAFTATDDGSAKTLLDADAELEAIADLASNGLITRTGAGTISARTITGTTSEITVTNGDGVSGNPTLSLDSDIPQGSIKFFIDGGGSAITTGVKSCTRVPFDFSITKWRITAPKESGSTVVDIWKDSYANFPPTVADTIAGTEKPTLSSAQKNEDTALSSFSGTITEGDYVCANVDSATTVTYVEVSLEGVKT